jgi:hypothetical protein
LHLSLGLLALVHAPAAKSVEVAPSPVSSAKWACGLEWSTFSVDVDVAYDASTREVTVDIPSSNHHFTRTATFDEKYLMWTEDATVGSAVLWTIVRANLEIRLTRIMGSMPRVNVGRCHAK